MPREIAWGCPRLGSAESACFCVVVTVVHVNLQVSGFDILQMLPEVVRVRCPAVIAIAVVMLTSVTRVASMCSVLIRNAVYSGSSPAGHRHCRNSDGCAVAHVGAVVEDPWCRVVRSWVEGDFRGGCWWD
jgi:hypothetical protein